MGGSGGKGRGCSFLFTSNFTLAKLRFGWVIDEYVILRGIETSDNPNGCDTIDPYEQGSSDMRELRLECPRAGYEGTRGNDIKGVDAFCDAITCHVFTGAWEVESVRPLTASVAASGKNSSRPRPRRAQR